MKTINNNSGKRIATAALRFCVVFAILLFSNTLFAQETIFTLARSNHKKADEYFVEKNYQSALSLYLNLHKKKSGSIENYLKIAKCYFYLNRFATSVYWFNKYIGQEKDLPEASILIYAEALAGVKQYGQAGEWYKKYLSHNPEDAVVQKKLWQFSNLEYLFEDSVHYNVKPIEINTPHGELCAVKINKGIVFTSNRKEVQVIERLDATTHTPFYKLFFSAVTVDTALQSPIKRYTTPQSFFRMLSSKYHQGPLAFYNSENSVVYAASLEGDKKTLGLFFAEANGGSWKAGKPFPYNSDLYTLSEPSMSEDGSTLYFSSTMPGGYGGKDLYKSTNQSGQWSKPVNLGELVNTSRDECFPFIHNDSILYFASNGHPGLGGLDLFKIPLGKKNPGELKNLGFPVNSSADDFGITLSPSGIDGYLSSNRAKGNFNDDIYELEIDLQTYPIEIQAILRYKDANWKDSSELKIFSDAKLTLIDNVRNIELREFISDSAGNFSLTIPYFSQYKLRIVDQDGQEMMVSLDMTKHRKLDKQHYIVVVKDLYNEPNAGGKGKN